MSDESQVKDHKIGVSNMNGGWINSSCMDGRANPLMDRKVVRVVLFEMVAVVTSTTTAGCSVV